MSWPNFAVFGKGAVGAFFDDNGNAEGALSQFEEEVRAAGDNNVSWWMITKTEKLKMSIILFLRKETFQFVLGFSVRNKDTVIFSGIFFQESFQCLFDM